jgi:hypothetical protein
MIDTRIDKALLIIRLLIEPDNQADILLLKAGNVIRRRQRAIAFVGDMSLVRGSGERQDLYKSKFCGKIKVKREPQTLSGILKSTRFHKKSLVSARPGIVDAGAD